MNNLSIAYTCNVRKQGMEDERFGEFESPTTIDAVTKALERFGATVELIDVGKNIYHVLEKKRSSVDLVFNNAEGFEEKELREAIVPFFCEYLHIPYTGSSPKTFINKMDKATAKRIVAYDGVLTAKFQLMTPGEKLEDLEFPLMVKPYSEGTSIGISQKSKVHDVLELETALEEVYSLFQQPALVEEFLDGTEYTVGIIGRNVLPVLEIDLAKIPGSPVIRDPHVKDIENPYISHLSWTEKAQDYARIAVQAHEALEVRDYNRMDFRERNGTLHFLEANIIPGIHPTEADITNMCKHAGISHEDMIALIVNETVGRLKTQYPVHFLGKTDLLQQIAENALRRAKKAGSIVYHDREYKLLGAP